MKKHCVVALGTGALSCFVASAAITEQSWNTALGEGWYTNAVNWSNHAVPEGDDHLISFKTTSGHAGAVDTTVRLTDFDTHALAYSVQMYAPARFVFDATGSLFRMVEPLATEAGKGRYRDGYWYPITVSSGGSYAMMMNFIGATTGNVFAPIFSLSNLVWTVDKPSSDAISLKLAGGEADFIPDWNDAAKPLTRNLEFAKNAGDGTFSLKIKDADIRFPEVKWLGNSASSLLEMDGGSATVMSSLSWCYPSPSAAAAGTNELLISNGGRLSLAGAATTASFGHTWLASSRYNHVVIQGVGSELDLSALTTGAFYGNTDLSVEDGATFRLPATFSMSVSSPDGTVNRRLLVSGSGTTFDTSKAATTAPVFSTQLDVIVTNGAQVVFAGASPNFASLSGSVQVGGAESRFACPGGSFVFKNSASLSVCDGAVLDGGNRLRLGNSLANGQRRTYRVTGAGSTICSTNATESAWFYGAVDFVLEDGAIADFSGGTANWGVITDEALSQEYLTTLTVNGADTRFYGHRNFRIGTWVLGGKTGEMTINDGYFGPKNLSDSTAYVSVVLAGHKVATAVLNLNGGLMRLPAQGTDATQASMILGPGDATFNLNGGTFVGGDIYPGYNGATELKHQVFNLNGGTATVDRIYFGYMGTADQQYQDATVNLNGGVLQAKSIFLNASGMPGGASAYHGTHFVVDGGTLVPLADADDFIYNIADAQVGAHGLVLDVGGHSVGLSQSFADKAGEKGVFTVRGGRTATFKMASYSVATTVVDAATLTVDANRTLATDLMLMNGATLSTAGAATVLTLSGLTAPNGTLLVDAGNKIHLTSDRVDVSGLTLRYSTAPGAAASCEVFEFNGDMTGNASVQNLMRKLYVPQSISGKHAKFEAVYDAGTGKTTVTMTYQDDVPCSDKTVWNGPAWTGDGWSAGVPTSSRVASFSYPAASAGVSVPARAKVGALEITAGEGYTLTATQDAVLDFAGEEGSAWMNVTAGTNVFDVPLTIAARLPISVGEGAALDFARSVEGDRTIAKTGKGAFRLGAANAFRIAPEVGGGINVVAHGKAFSGHDNAFAFTGDTLAFTNAEPMVLAERCDVRSAVSAKEAMVLRADSDVVFSNMQVSAGAPVKIGRGKMTVVASSAFEQTLSLAGSSGGGTGVDSTKMLVNNHPMAFTDDGTSPSSELTGSYAGFNVAEGEVVIIGAANAQKVNMKNSVAVGSPVSGARGSRTEPILTIDGARVDAVGQGHCFFGWQLGMPGFVQTQATVRVVRGGSFTTSTLHVGDGSSAADACMTIAVSNATLAAGSALYFSSFEGTGDPAESGAHWLAKDATVGTTETTYQWGNYVYGRCKADFENSFVGGVNEPTVLFVNRNAAGEIYLHDGGTFSYKKIEMQAGSGPLRREFKIAFDDALWSPGSGDVTIAADSMVSEGGMNYGQIEMRGKGVRLSPAEGDTFLTLYPFTGLGGMIKEGAGTVAFGANTYQFAGTLDVWEGTVDLTNAGMIDRTSIKGNGTVKNGTFGRITVPLSVDDGAAGTVPTFSSCQASMIIADLGHTESDPLDLESLKGLTVAKYTGAVPAGYWKLKGTGHRGVRGVFVQRDGIVVLEKVETSGFLMIVR